MSGERQRWDLCVARPKSNATEGQSDVWWHRVGSSYLNDKGQLVLFLDSLPLPNAQGTVQVMGFVPKPREEGAGGGFGTGTRSAAPARGTGTRPAPRGRGRPAEDDDEEKPF